MRVLDGGVERAGLGDLEELVALARGTAGAPHWTVEVWRELLGEEGASGRRGRVFVVRGADGEVTGFAVGTMVLAAGVAELESVAVAEGARRRGVGQALCRAVVGWAREMAAKAVELEVAEANKAAAWLYERMGFREVRRRRGYYGAGRDARVMRLELG